MKRSIVWTCVKAGYGLSIGGMGGLLTVSFISHTLRDWAKKDDADEATDENCSEPNAE